MNWLTYTRGQLLLSQQVFWKRLGVALVGTLLPLGFGVFGSLNARGRTSVEGIPGEEFMLTGFVGFALFFVMYNLVNSTTSRRDALVYKRLRSTSLPDSAIFAGEATSASVPSLAVVAVLIGYGIVYLKLPAPADAPLLLLGIVLAAAAFALLAIALSGILPSAEMSMWIITPIMVVLLMLSGIMIPLSEMPTALAQFSQFTPLTATVQIIRTAWTGQNFGSIIGAGAHPAVGFVSAFRECSGPVGILVGWSALSIALGRRLFRWDPRRR
ncbi:hypothetical protein GCM10007304_38490 [Rhodococcoides trifolii]|uniref:ABC-2 type transporter transmembrane domain-containing protein n=1 Tax=Rhodococcoides trifolii TaxID=908250 RepID=A0A917LGD2_9NOCA|nr:ABC transporter permease [Rhodococcus trifolii]GGG20945.1 hypothetical protein GCM10007304_38490 [Rhodococcus trifolii]